MVEMTSGINIFLNFLKALTAAFIAFAHGENGVQVIIFFLMAITVVFCSFVHGGNDVR